MTSSAISVIRDQMTLLNKEMLLRTDTGHIIHFQDCGFDEVLSNGMRTALFGNQEFNIVRCSESGSTAAFDEESFQF